MGGPWTTQVQPAAVPHVPAPPAVAWSELHPDERRTARAAARARAGIADPRVAVAALTYGQRLASALTVIRAVWPVAALPVLVPVAILVAIMEELGVPSLPLYLGGALILTTALVVGLRAILGLRALASAGGLGLEMAALRAARSGPVGPAGGPQPLTVAPISPIASRARAAVVALALPATLAVFLIAALTTPGDRIYSVVSGVLLVGVTWLYRRSLPGFVLSSFRPARARLSTDAAELHQLGVTVPWADVVGVDIRFPLLGSGLAFEATPDRVVVLRVRDPQHHRGAGRVARWTMRANLREYGSPLAFTAGPRMSQSLGEVLAFISTVTDTPIRYDHTDPA
jgi:hypothetical protein